MTFLSGASYLTEEGFWLYTEDPPFSEALKLLGPFVIAMLYIEWLVSLLLSLVANVSVRVV